MSKAFRAFALAAALFLAPALASAQFAAQSLWGGTSTGSANAQAINIQNLRGALPVGVPILFIPGFSSSGPATLNIASIGATAVVKRSAAGLVPFASGEWRAGVETEVVWDGSNLVSNVIGQTAPAPVGTTGFSASTSAPLSSATLTGTQVVVATSLSGSSFTLANYSQTLNVSTTGAGGMDGITALAANDFVDVFAIYNPVTGATSVLGCADSACHGQMVYGNGGLPAGYVASALAAVWPTDGSKSLKAGAAVGKTFYYRGFVNILTGQGSQASLTSQSIATAVPRSASTWSGIAGTSNSVANQFTWTLASDSGGTGWTSVGSPDAVNGAGAVDASMLNSAFVGPFPILTSQVTFFAYTQTSGVAGRLDVTRYGF